MEENNKNIKLNDFLELQFSNYIFSGFPERVRIATEFLNCYNDVRLDSKKKEFWKYTTLLNPEFILMYECKSDDEYEAVSPYTFKFLENLEIDEKGEFTNFAFVPKRFFKTKPFWGKEHKSCIFETLKVDETDVVYIISRILFNICFTVHPYKGQEYYASLNINNDFDRDFFNNEHKNIFVLDGKNRFINGYHENIWELWSQLTLKQREFWMNALDGNIKDFSSLRDEWNNLYSFAYSETKTPCGEIIPTMIFSEEQMLICAENILGNKKIFCYKCKDSLVKKCKTCALNVNQMYAEVLTLKLRSVIEENQVSQNGENEKITKEREIVVFDGKVVTLPDVANQNNKNYLRIVASKKANILGAKNLLDTEIRAICGKQEKCFAKDLVIPLLSGTRISINDNITLIVPGEPVEKVEKKDLQIKLDVSREINASVKLINKEENKQIPISKPATTQTSMKKKDLIVDKYSVVSLTGEVYEVLREYKFHSSLVYCGEDFDLYKVKSNKTGKAYDMWVTNFIARDDILETSLKTIISLRLNYKHLLSPITILKQEGFAKGKYAYLTEQLPSGNCYPIQSIINKKISVSRMEIVKAFLKIFELVSGLHNRGISIKTIIGSNLYFDEISREIYIRQPHYISKEGINVKKYESQYMPDEINAKMFIPDKISDCYSLSIFLFKALLKQDKFERNIFDKPKGVIKTITSRFRGWVMGNDKETIMGLQNEIPDYVLDLFERTFTNGVLSPKYMTMNDQDKQIEYEKIKKERLDRPTAEDWCSKLKRWIDEKSPKGQV